MASSLFTEADLRQCFAAGIAADELARQIALLQAGVPPVKLNRPATIEDGIVRISSEEQPQLVARHDAAARQGRLMKFVPASGAASRMFVHWQEALAKGSFSGLEAGKKFAHDLHRFAFFPELKKAIAGGGEDIETLLREGRLHRILYWILTGQGLNYGHLPKALIKFHSYGQDGSRTALEEHLVESSLYAAAGGRECRLHFTVSEEHRTAVSSFLEEVVQGYEERLGMAFHPGLSSQSSASNTVALEGDRLYRNHVGHLILRPGGHGALLTNLQALEEDIVFIKNIDNVAPDWLKPEITFYKQVLGGYFLRLEEEMFSHLRTLSAGAATETQIREVQIFCRQSLHLVFSPAFVHWPLARRQEFIMEKLDRPLRVCGMVRNEGEPGGGPFWIDGAEGSSLQIVEAHQIDSSSEQKAIWSAATHFNPVDLVCGLRNYEGRKFNLPLFADPQAAGLTQKIEGGRKIKVLEHPGLWNGGMARWNTVFVEVPIATFNPVKTIEDLLRPQHLPAAS